MNKAIKISLFSLLHLCFFSGICSNGEIYSLSKYSRPHTQSFHFRFTGFGLGGGKAPKTVKNLAVNRYKDRRDAMINWDQQPNCQGYNVLWGIAPDKLYNAWMVYDKNYLELKSLSVDQIYYFSVEAFNENGVSEKAKVVKSE